MGMEVMRPKPTCDEPLRVKPAKFQVNCLNGRPARPRQQTAAPTSYVLLNLGAAKRELTQNRILHPPHSATRKCGRDWTRKPEADVLSDTKTRTERRGDCRAESVCECGEPKRGKT